LPELSPDQLQQLTLALQGQQSAQFRGVQSIHLPSTSSPPPGNLSTQQPGNQSQHRFMSSVKAQPENRAGGQWPQGFSNGSAPHQHPIAQPPSYVQPLPQGQPHYYAQPPPPSHPRPHSYGPPASSPFSFGATFTGEPVFNNFTYHFHGSSDPNAVECGSCKWTSYGNPSHCQNPRCGASFS
jgi:hypothetical protein